MITAACGTRFQQLRLNAVQPADPDTLEIHVGFLCANTYVAGLRLALPRARFTAGAIPGATTISHCVDGTEFYYAGIVLSPVEAPSDDRPDSLPDGHARARHARVRDVR